MKNNSIIVSVTIGFNYLKINASQTIENHSICLFSQKQEFNALETAQNFIKDSLATIEKKTMTKVEQINLIFDDFSLKNLEIKNKVLDKTFVNFKNNSITLDESTYLEFQNSIKRDVMEDPNYQSKKLITLMPLKFNVKDDAKNINESFTDFPLGKQVSKISCSFSATFIANDLYQKIMALFAKTDVKFNQTLVASQLSFYKFNGSVSDKLTFTLDIENHRSLLITTINKVVIARDELKFSYNDLVEKVSKSHNISLEIAHNLIQNYGFIYSANNDDPNDVIYLNQEDCSITKKGLQSLIKSFLKTLSIEAREIISLKSNHNEIDFDVNMLGKLENISNIDDYCGKYLHVKSIINSGKHANNFNSWNPAYQDHNALIKLAKVINNKIQPIYHIQQTALIQSKKTISFKMNKKRVQNNSVALA